MWGAENMSHVLQLMYGGVGREALAADDAARPGVADSVVAQAVGEYTTSRSDYLGLHYRTNECLFFVT